ncbi:MAG: GNAT family N-acetyltransferase, partial [Chloroflexi bacterium]|nr:GNAT family N-acetyltransferase [Chloroflexota bacterium]
MIENSVEINGKRIILRDWLLQDVDDYAHWQMPGHKWQDFDGPYYPRTKAEDIPSMIQKLRNKIETNEWDAVRKHLVIANHPANKLIGRVSWYWVSEETNWLAIGIAVYDPAHWRRGIGYEALGLWCEYLWTAVPAIVRLDIRTWSGNIGMMRLAEKLGF